MSFCFSCNPASAHNADMQVWRRVFVTFLVTGGFSGDSAWNAQSTSLHLCLSSAARVIRPTLCVPPGAGSAADALAYLLYFYPFSDSTLNIPFAETLFKNTHGSVSTAVCGADILNVEVFQFLCY